jgi:hypothetical protein
MRKWPNSSEAAHLGDMAKEGKRDANAAGVAAVKVSPDLTVFPHLADFAADSSPNSPTSQSIAVAIMTGLPRVGQPAQGLA